MSKYQKINQISNLKTKRHFSWTLNTFWNVYTIDIILKSRKKYLYSNNKWWIINFYVNNKVLSLFISAVLIVILNLDETELNELQKKYFNAKNYYDKDIFHHFRRAHLTRDIIIKANWLFKLFKIKIRDNNLLEKRAAKNPQTQHL